MTFKIVFFLLEEVSNVLKKKGEKVKEDLILGFNNSLLTSLSFSFLFSSGGIFGFSFSFISYMFTFNFANLFYACDLYSSMDWKLKKLLIL